MKTKTAIATALLYSTALIAAAGPGDNIPGVFIERKKTIVKVFDVRPNEMLNIDNRYGDVKVLLWEKQAIRIDITITANAPSEQKVSEAINAVDIEEKRGNNNITVQTVLGPGTQRINWRGKKGENSLRIDYLIQMPKQNPLNLKNSYGDTDIARFIAPLAVETRYGNFRAEDLASMANDIIVQYGNAVIGQMGMGKLHSNHSEINLEKVKSLELVNKFGSLNIGEVGSLKADIGYCGARIGTLTDNGTVKVHYSNNFSINESTADNIDIQAAYSEVVIPVRQPAKFDVSVTYGNFQYPTKTAVSFTNKSGTSKTKQYEGNIGSEQPASTIRVISTYGNVKLKD